MKYWGKMGAFWSGLWGLLAGAAFLIIPGVGPVVAAGPVTGWIIGATEAETIDIHRLPTVPARVA
jgi:hypothetical protein